MGCGSCCYLTLLLVFYVRKLVTKLDCNLIWLNKIPLKFEILYDFFTINNVSKLKALILMPEKGNLSLQMTVACNLVSVFFFYDSDQDLKVIRRSSEFMSTSIGI